MIFKKINSVLYRYRLQAKKKTNVAVLFKADYVIHVADCNFEINAVEVTHSEDLSVLYIPWFVSEISEKDFTMPGKDDDQCISHKTIKTVARIANLLDSCNNRK